MAISNRDRVQRGFELLAEGLEPFVNEVISAATADGGETYSKSDLAVQLNVIADEQRAEFKDRLSRGEQAIASILREERNKWPHTERYSPEDAAYVLDLIERLLTSVGAPRQAAAAHTEKRNLLQLAQERQTRESVKESTRAAAAVPGMIQGQALKPWTQVLAPHPDVRSNQYVAAEFAADLYEVAYGDAGEEYADPVRFFERTYLTEGLRGLVTMAAKRLSGDGNVDPVINLQTNFGGGKTHSMLALFHLASGRHLTEFPQELHDLIVESGVDWGSLAKVNTAVLVGNKLSATSGADHEGTHVNTLWGELAMRLGGKAAYERIAADDDAGTNPGQRLKDLIAAHSPCVILIDEWVAYARELYGRDDLPAGTFDTQFSFAQTLTEAVKAVPGALLVVSIPASKEIDAGESATSGVGLEVGGLNGREALKRLQHVVRRVAWHWTPASQQESFEIVRRRLFEEPDAEAKTEIAAVARHFVEFYRSKHGEFPRECYEGTYEDRIKACYPIHPELFDRLYKDWSTLDRFQRTRGVLRMMSSVVHSLWQADDSGPLIMPGSIPLQDAKVVSELNQYLDDEWKVIISTDVDGDASVPVRIDNDRKTFGQRRITRRLARTVFFGSAPTLRSEHRGIERQYVWLGVAVPGDTIGNFGSAIDLLAQRTTYFYPETGRYYYSTQPSITRTVQDRAEALRNRPEEVWREITDRLRSTQAAHSGQFRKVHAAPEGTGEVRDWEEARLVLLHPRYPHRRNKDESPALEFAAQCLRQCGSAQRVNVNQLVFLAPDEQRLLELEDAVRDFLAWKGIYEERGEEELNLNPQQVRLAETRRAHADQAVDLRISATYNWLTVPDQPEGDKEYTLKAIRCDGSEDGLAVRASQKLVDAGLFAPVFGTASLRRDLDTDLRRVWERGHVTFGALWGYYRRHPYLTRLRDRSVLEDAVLRVLTEGITWDVEGFALAEGYDEERGAYTGLALPMEGTFGQVTDQTLLVAPERAIAQREQERAAARAREEAARAAAEAVSGTEAFTTSEPGAGVPSTGAGPRPAGPGMPQASLSSLAPEGPAPARHARFFGSYPMDAERIGKDFTKFIEEILPHLRSVPGAEVRLRLEVEAHSPDGYPEDKVRVVTENARTLKFEPYGFEDE
ncbi:DUF499 domain-containing protein [Streptomyces flaveus]|uniref:Swt1-like HEPN domain-containing protein n=1 Tax=Streptomyces flaveus TaxID=66370 RepID=A0A917VG58_9ACTN|nr:DUF499 domain-containing protein [Streptomyces flaveus]GGK73387.1 hypothetical protein GCM10010094_38060 [Streptomyces flaveus]